MSVLIYCVKLPPSTRKESNFVPSSRRCIFNLISLPYSQVIPRPDLSFFIACRSRTNHSNPATCSIDLAGKAVILCVASRYALYRREDYPEGRFTLAFVGFGNAQTSTALALTHNWDISRYDRGNGFWHLVLKLLMLRKLAPKDHNNHNGRTP